MQECNPSGMIVLCVLPVVLPSSLFFIAVESLSPGIMGLVSALEKADSKKEERKALFALSQSGY